MNNPNHRPRRLRLVDPDQRRGLGGKVIGVANAGHRVKVGISLPDTRHHLHLLGPTGTGKSSLLLRMILDDAANGRGVAVFDPKGDLIRDLLARLPAACGDRLVIIDPDETTAPPALNLLDPVTGGGSPHNVAAHVTGVMAKVWSRWWGHRTADITHHALLTLAHTPGATLAHLPRLLSDYHWRHRRVAAATRRIGTWQAGTLAEFWDGFDVLPPGHRASLTAPLLAKLRLVLTHPLAAGLFGVPATTFTLADILDGGILLARLPKGSLGEDGCRLVGSLLLAGLWQATAARSRSPEDQRLDCAVVVDECHNFLHLPIGIDDALAEARGLRTSFVLAHQYLGQLSHEMAEAIDANARNKVYFALAPRDAADQARHVRPWLDDGDLTRLGGFEVVLRSVAGGRVIPPVTADTLPPPRPVPGRAERLRQAARERTGLETERRRILLGEATIDPGVPEPEQPRSASMPMSTVGHNTFVPDAVNAVNVGPNECSNEESNEESNDDEHSPQQSELNTPPAWANGPEEDWWTGSDS
ncbi:MAG: type IV secretory system conjugative DNA transfer family protein [Dactylosporangium sp.]|nr:type IV secretory system conjugative DNA transfer family protein [Dactylosporangium sp.]NNJ63213.1 type IV secretory system conjugative DNA transfer family protein [Dactylosporangium sp.]